MLLLPIFHYTLLLSSPYGSKASSSVSHNEKYPHKPIELVFGLIECSCIYSH